MAEAGDLLHVVTDDTIGPGRRAAGRALVWGSAAVMAAAFAALTLGAWPFETWRPALYAAVLWAVCLCAAQVVIHGQRGARTLFVLPAALFVGAMVVFPLGFGVLIALSDWNLSSPDGRQFNGLDNLRQMWRDPFYWNALANMVLYTAAIAVEYAIAFGLALILASEIRGRRFFRVAFLLPLMLSPVAVSWMIGKSMLEARFGPVARLARGLGWEQPSFFGDPWMARLMIMLMDAWTYVPFLMIMLLAGLQSIPREVQEAARVDGASRMARLLGGDVPADAAGLDHRDPDPRDLQAQARRHRDQRHRGGPGRGHRHRDVVHLPGVSRPLERGLRHAPGDGLPRRSS